MPVLNWRLVSGYLVRIISIVLEVLMNIGCWILVLILGQRLADILHNGVIVQKVNECYYNSALCNIALGSFWCALWEQLFAFLFYLFSINNSSKRNKQCAVWGLAAKNYKSVGARNKPKDRGFLLSQQTGFWFVGNLNSFILTFLIKSYQIEELSHSGTYSISISFF